MQTEREGRRKGGMEGGREAGGGKGVGNPEMPAFIVITQCGITDIFLLPHIYLRFSTFQPPSLQPQPQLNDQNDFHVILPTVTHSLHANIPLNFAKLKKLCNFEII